MRQQQSLHLKAAPVPPQGGHLSTEGGRTRVTYFAEEDLRMSAILQMKGTFLYPVTKYGGGGENPLTIHEIYAALTPSDSRSDLASEFAAAKQVEDYKILS